MATCLTYKHQQVSIFEFVESLCTSAAIYLKNPASETEVLIDCVDVILVYNFKCTQIRLMLKWHKDKEKPILNIWLQNTVP